MTEPDNKNEVIGKKFKILLKTGRRYTAVVKDFNGTIYTCLDKFNSIVKFNDSEIATMEEQQ